MRERLLAEGTRRAARAPRSRSSTRCCVTHEAVRKSRQAASRAARTHARRVRDRLRRQPRKARSRAAARTSTSSRGRARRRRPFVAGDVGAIGCVQADARLDRVRAFVKVQDGCSFSCHFCVIPLVRGASRSRRGRGGAREVRRRVAQGHREVVLTGINLGCYRDREAGYSLARLVREAGASPGSTACGCRRSRSTTSSASSSPRSARRRRSRAHLHVPLQSGDDGVLRAMRRRYSAATYLRRVAALDRLQPDQRRDRRLPGRGRARRSTRTLDGSRAPGSRRFTSSRTRRGRARRPRTADTRAARGQEGARRAASRAASARPAAPLAGEDRSRATSCWSTVRAAATATTTRRGSAAGTPVGELVRVRARAVTEEGIVGA